MKQGGNGLVFIATTNPYQGGSIQQVGCVGDAGFARSLLSKLLTVCTRREEQRFVITRAIAVVTVHAV